MLLLFRPYFSYKLVISVQHGLKIISYNFINITFQVVLQDLDISSLAPRKPDWDLKRDVAKKLEKLERRTQKAIAELIWERLKEGNEENLSAMVSLNENRPADDD